MSHLFGQILFVLLGGGVTAIAFWAPSKAFSRLQGPDSFGRTVRVLLGSILSIIITFWILHTCIILFVVKPYFSPFQEAYEMGRLGLTVFYLFAIFLTLLGFRKRTNKPHSQEKTGK